MITEKMIAASEAAMILASGGSMRRIVRRTRRRGSYQCASALAATAEKEMMMSGARYEIAVDGTARTHRDREDLAYDAATLLKIKQPHAETRDESDPRCSTK
jgi:hypothetical protein